VLVEDDTPGVSHHDNEDDENDDVLDDLEGHNNQRSRFKLITAKLRRLSFQKITFCN
jgi:hypothetical protein